MVIDTSALVAILQNEPERQSLNEAIANADSRRLSVASWLEVSIIVETRFGAEGTLALDRFLDRAKIELVPVDLEQGRSARSAYSRFGKGRHPAALNFGDCFSYALADVVGEPILFKGDDFSKTDLPQFL